jgi:hypothetical protein
LTSREELNHEKKILEDRLGFKLTIDNNSIYGGARLERIMNAGYGVTEINNYRIPKKQFYHMLLAMNRLLDEKERFDKEIKGNKKEFGSNCLFVVDLLKSKNKIYYHQSRDNIIESLKNQMLDTTFASYLFQYESDTKIDPDKRPRILKNVYGCNSENAYDTDPVWRLL